MNLGLPLSPSTFVYTNTVARDLVALLEQNPGECKRLTSPASFLAFRAEARAQSDRTDRDTDSQIAPNYGIVIMKM